eukprot:955181_1
MTPMHEFWSFGFLQTKIERKSPAFFTGNRQQCMPPKHTKLSKMMQRITNHSVKMATKPRKIKQKNKKKATNLAAKHVQNSSILVQSERKHNESTQIKSIAYV